MGVSTFFRHFKIYFYRVVFKIFYLLNLRFRAFMKQIKVQVQEINLSINSIVDRLTACHLCPSEDLLKIIYIHFNFTDLKIV